MKMNKKLILGGAVGLAAATTIGVASAYQGSGFGKGPNFPPEKHDQIVKAVESNDYNAWKELVAGRRVTEVINEENFSKFAEMHNLIKEGKYEEAGKIREELGLKMKRGFKAENRLEKRKAIEESDYNAWKELVAGRRVAEVIDSEDKFNKLVESHNLIKEGKYEEAREIRESLGLKHHRGGGHWRK